MRLQAFRQRTRTTPTMFRVQSCYEKSRSKEKPCSEFGNNSKLIKLN